MFSDIINWINGNAEKGAEYILKPILNLPSVLKFMIVVIIAFLAFVGLIRVARKALKIVVGVAVVFIVLLIAWLIFFK